MTSSRRPVVVALAAAVAVLAACRPALRDERGLADPTAGIERSGPGADAALAEAESLYATRDLPAVRRSVDRFLEAAADGALAGLAGATKARVWLANEEPTPEARRAAAVAAVESGQWCEREHPDAIECAYWLAAALGVQARERRSTATSALPEMLARLDRVAEESPGFDDAGPDRLRCLIYVRAPGWPVGPGDPDLAVEHGRRAVELAPDYPPNHLCLAEALAEVGDAAAARRSWERARELAEERLAGGEDAARHWLEEARAGLGDGAS